MRTRWGRWHGYMDELEESMRGVGRHLAEIERLLAEKYERKTWRGEKRDSIDEEIVRRALDIPFLRELINSANRIDSLDLLINRGFIGREWRPGESREQQTSASRRPEPPAVDASRPAPNARPPARILAAERALQDRTRSLVVVLDHLVNTRNISAVVRSIEALGLQELHVIEPQGKPALERTLTTRAERWLDIVWHADAAEAINELRERGYRILAADFAEGAQAVESVPLCGPTALVFGSEQLGISQAMRDRVDGFFYLPNSGFTAYINVSVAAAISVYALDRRMREAKLRQTLSEEDERTLRPAWYAMLARGDPKKEAEYLAWAAHPPTLDSTQR